LAVSLQPSGKKWSSFRYSVGNWLLPGKGPNEIGTYQPVATSPNDDWTDDFSEVARWLRWFWCICGQKPFVGRRRGSGHSRQWRETAWN